MNNGRENTGLTFPGIRWAAFSLVFFGIPLFLVWFVFNNVWREAEKSEQQQLEERLERVAMSFDQFRSTDEFVVRIFRLLTQRVFQKSGNPVEKFAAYRKHLHRRFPGLFEFTFIDGNGRPRPELCDRQPAVTVLSRFADAIRAKTLADDDKLLIDQWRLFQGYLGNILRPQQLEFGSLKKAVHADERHFVILSPWHEGGMLIARINRPPTWDSIAVRDRARYLNRHSRQMKAFVVDEMSDWQKNIEMSDWQRHIASEGGDGQTIGRLLAEFKVSPRTSIQMGNALWAHAVINPSVRVFVGMPQRRFHERAKEKILLSLALAAIFIALSVPTWMVMSGRWLPYISIRQKLVGLFLYMVGLPLAFMSVVAADYLGEKRIVLEKQVHDGMEKSLQLFDRRMPMIIGELDRVVTQSLALPLPSGAPMRETMIARMKKFSARSGLRAGLLINESSEVVYSDGAKGYDKDRNHKLLKPIYENIFRQYDRESGIDELRDSQIYKLSAAGGIDIEAMYADIVSSLGHLTQFNFTGKRTIQTILPIQDAGGKVRFLLSVGWSRYKIVYMYLEKYMLAATRKLDDTRWITVDRENPANVFPSSFKLPPQVEMFATRLRGRGQTVRESMDLLGNRYLLTGIPGQELSNIDLVAITSDRFIRSEIGRLQWLAGFVSLAILLTGATVGTLLARKFLEPIGNLAEGVASLRRREFKKRLPILDRDELGDLSHTFNDMMEGMADLEVARIVQESLFPNKSLALPPFGIHGSCVPATQAGGDYYDFFPMPDGRVMLLVGDVSGHGVGAAMVMAMAKALVAHMEAQAADPSAILASLNTTLLKVLDRQRIMSCFMAFLDGKALRMTFSNAGHNDPFVVRGKREVIQIEGNRAFPLGASKRNRLASSEFAFEAGDRLILYTDGLIEAEALDGQPVDYDRFIAALPELMRDSAEATEQAILDWHRQIVRPGPQSDDITVVVVTIDRV